MDFIALDFEIANYNLNSACSLGLVFVDDNKIVDEKYFLIRPPRLHFNEKFSSIHGLAKADIKDAPTFDVIWEEIREFFSEDIFVVAHNAYFDMSVLKNCLLEFSLPVPDFTYVCSIPVSTRACRGEGVGASLKERTKRFGITLDEHHHALADARACAQLVIECVRAKNRKSLQAYCSTYTSIPVKSFAELKPQTSFINGKGKANRRGKTRKFDQVNISDITPASTDDFDKNHPFFGKHLVFTGNLEKLDRKTAMQKVVDAGGILKSGVSSKTDFLVTGTQDKALVGSSGFSSKEVKARELIEKGHEIQILTEADFLQLLDGDVRLSS
nr:exonuclease domain-containing protein [Evansella caseinilytica]